MKTESFQFAQNSRLGHTGQDTSLSWQDVDDLLKDCFREYQIIRVISFKTFAWVEAKVQSEDVREMRNFLKRPELFVNNPKTERKPGGGK